MLRYPSMKIEKKTMTRNSMSLLYKPTVAGMIVSQRNLKYYTEIIQRRQRYERGQHDPSVTE